ncbi:MAG: hypothetical protein IPK72_10905 [Candidatus Eisenbacteria bacterium]|nr:hypothetical protein [Candidatus Eisenbacteria bacterium]
MNSAAVGQFSPAIAYDVFGNWCPQEFTFDVLQAVAGGVGNRVYNDYDRVPPSNTNYAQVEVGDGQLGQLPCGARRLHNHVGA